MKKKTVNIPSSHYKNHYLIKQQVFFSCRNSEEQKHPNYAGRQFCVLDTITNKIILTSNFSLTHIYHTWEQISTFKMLNCSFRYDFCMSTVQKDPVMWQTSSSKVETAVNAANPVLNHTKVLYCSHQACCWPWALHTITSIFSTELIQTHQVALQLSLII